MSKVKNILFTVWNIFRHHKYIWTLIIFIGYVGFLSESSFSYRYKITKENEGILAEIKKYEEEYAREEKKLNELKNNPEALVRVAREVHKMSAPGEDVYYIVEE